MKATNLLRCSYLVLDEADKMFHLGMHQTIKVNFSLNIYLQVLSLKSVQFAITFSQVVKLFYSVQLLRRELKSLHVTFSPILYELSRAILARRIKT